MPACKHGNLCKIKNCLLKHTDEKEISECVFYRQVNLIAAMNFGTINFYQWLNFEQK